MQLKLFVLPIGTAATASSDCGLASGNSGCASRNAAKPTFTRSRFVHSPTDLHASLDSMDRADVAGEMTGIPNSGRFGHRH
jgi:hypothetical protein